MAFSMWSFLMVLIMTVNTTRVKPRVSEDTVILVTDWADPGRILNVSLKHMNFTAIPVSNVNRPVALDYDHAHAMLYWTDVFLKQIRSTDIRTQTDTVLVQLNKSATPDGIAVDAEEGVVFFTDAGNDIVSRVDFHNGQSRAIVEDDLKEPRAIIIHKEVRKIYWTDWGEKPKIETADYDGSDRVTLISTGLAWPNGLALDENNKRLFWCDAKLSVIETIHLDGSDRKVILEEPTAHYFDIFYHHGMLYFTDWQRQTSLLHMPACGGKVGSLVSKSFKQLSGLHVISKSDTGVNYTLPECLAKCSHCLNKGNCDVVTGRCPDGCEAGWTGETCSTGSVRTESPLTTQQSGTPSSESKKNNATTVASTMKTDQQEKGRTTVMITVLEGDQSWTSLSFGMTVALALGCFSAALLMAIIILVVIYRIRRKNEKERFSNLAWAREQAFTNNTYTLMAGDTEDRSNDYLVPIDDTMKTDDDADHLYEDIDEETCGVTHMEGTCN